VDGTQKVGNVRVTFTEIAAANDRHVLGRGPRRMNWSSCGVS
jgi:hypothetical protein